MIPIIYQHDPRGVTKRFDANGNRTSLTCSNGVTTTYTYNAANWVTSLQNTRNGETLSGFTYTYYASGSQKSKTDISGTVTTYMYDGLNRLVQESETGGQTVDYTYDANGNRAQMVVTGTEAFTTDYTYDANNRLLTETEMVDGKQHVTTYTYDANGNTLQVYTRPDALFTAMMHLISSVLHLRMKQVSFMPTMRRGLELQKLRRLASHCFF